MSWFLLALFFALWSSIGVSISKRVLKTTDVLVYLVFGSLFVLISMAAILVFRGAIPHVDSTFWLTVFTAALINVATSLFAFKAIKIAPISLLAPLAAFNPLAVTFFGFLFLQESVNLLKLFAILIIVAGVYLLNITDVKKGVFAPFINLFKNRGVQLMLLANILWGITPVFEKTAIFHTTPQNPLVVTFMEGVFLTSFFFPLMLARTKQPFVQFRKNMWWYILPAPVAALASWSAFTAFSLNNVGYVSAVFKLSILFTILWGGLFFKEKRIRERFLGASVMLLGTILLIV